MPNKWQITILVVILLIITSAFVFIKIGKTNELEDIKTKQDTNLIDVITKPINQPLKTPEKVKGIYMTGYVFARQDLRNKLIKLVDDTELNALVIDFKDPNGKLMFEPQNDLLKTWPLSQSALSYEAYQKILQELQDKNIYTIARITTFQDSTGANTFRDSALKNKNGGLWLDYRGVSWLDMTNSKSWDLVVTQTKEAVLIGFDEIQFDYIRFPSDGNIKNIAYANFPSDKKKYQILDEFYTYLKANLTELNIPLSIDLFGLTYWQRQDQNYDLGIGQRLVDAGKYFDYISPMVYPSHYYSGILGFANPAAHPYEIVSKAMKDGNIMLANSSSTAGSRPWLQDFNMGAIYNSEMIKKQIKACNDNNCSGWLLWNAGNKYTTGALIVE
jgi:hypothetical protein